MTATRINSPSNRLYHGEVTDFEDAMNCVRGQCDHEIRFCNQYETETPGDPCHGLRESINRFKAAASKCEREYHARVKAVMLALAKEWQESDDEDVRVIGEALEDGDYSRLAL